MLISPASILFSSSSSAYDRRRATVKFAVLALALQMVFSVLGCGSGGYPGGSVVSLSSSSIVIDAGQKFSFTAKLASNPSITWSLNGASCSGATCGTVVSSDATTAIYTAPASVNGQLKVTLTASVPGTKSASTANITVNPAPAITGTPAAGTVGVAYNSVLSATGGTGTLTWSFAGGTLPPGITFNASTGVLAGTPTAIGTYQFAVQIKDQSDIPFTVSAQETITVSAGGGTSTVVVSGTTPAGTVGTAYSAQLNASGGTAPYTWTIAGGTLPNGLTLSPSTGRIAGTPTAQGASSFQAQATDAAGNKATGSFNITINSSSSQLTLTTTTLPGGTVGIPYTGTIGASGGTAPYSCTIAGTLPAGLTASGCTVSGTPTTPGTSTVNVTVTDSSNPAGTASGPVTITIAPATLQLTLSTLPAGTVNTPYSATIGVTGGVAPYNCTITAGTLPAGLTLTGCVVSGTPTTAGTASLTVRATDSASPANSVTGPVSITIAPAALSLTLSSLPNGTVETPYSATIGVAGGVAPYSCTITAGALPAGLTLTGCVVSGTPTTAGTASLTVRATDSASPANSVTGPVSITIAPVALSLTLSSLPNGTVGTPYTATIGVTGGTAPYSCTITAGALPAGLTLTGCVVSGTPTTAGTASLTVRATDSASPANSVTGPVSITIAPAALSLTLSSLPNGTVGTPYTSTIGVTGGTAPYSCTITAGILPAGLNLSGCLVSGTPTVAGTAALTVRATDSTSPANTVSGPVSLTIDPASNTIVITSPPAATVNVPYTGTIGTTGGTAPYTCSLTSGALPTGLVLSSGCIVSGTPTTAGTSTISVKVTDSSNPADSQTGPVTLEVRAASTTLTLSSPPDATVSTPYTGTIGVSGGTSPYTCQITAGALPAGLSIANCSITGTPTTAGTATLTVKATDAGTPQATTTAPVTLTVNPLAALALTGSLPNAILNQSYTQTLTATGGLQPYTYSLTAGSLPAGLSLNASTGIISGTPTVVGASSFTLTATDSQGTPQTASLPLVLLVTYAPTPDDSKLKGPYAYLFQGYDDVLAGVLAYQTATAGSFTADGAGVISAGEMDSNHQSSNPSTATVSSNAFLGTYTVGTDNRGSLTITELNADGTTGNTHTYAIALKAPVSPSTISTQVDMIEFDNNNLAGTRGSGTMLAQTAASFSTGLSGSFAFGMSGDTPCLPSCTLGIVAGPVASVGEFTTDNTSQITSGLSDANVATTKYSSQPLTGSYAAADANGRIALTMQTATTPTGVYPNDYAVYVVDANRAFVLSTDKHSSYMLLAGSMQKRAQPTFSNASMTGAYVGYENSLPNPGLASTLLQNVLNLSTATIFRGTATADGNCNITNVDTGGVDGLVSSLTGLLGNILGLTDLLGAYTHTGATTCAVSSTGRGTLQYPREVVLGLPIGTAPDPRVFYLSSPLTGYFLETGYAAIGKLQAQTGAPFSNATLNGTYIYGTAPAASLASTNSSGTLQANGAGQAITTQDLNVGVGNINLLQLGVTATVNYNLTDANAGRYLMNGTVVIYAISPTQFVTLDTNALTTSPSVSLLY